MSEMEKKILNQINSMKEEIVKFHQDIIRIPSENPPAKYKDISNFVESKFKELGLTTINKRNNVVGTHQGKDHPSLIIYSHIHTVEAFKGWTKHPFGGELIDGKIYGRGSCDDKACTTAQIFALKALIDAEIALNGKLTLAAVIDEETGGYNGAMFLLDKGFLKADACILGDGRGDFPIGYYGGAIFVTFIIKGKQTHGMSFPDLPPPNRNKFSGINAIEKMRTVLNFLRELQEEFSKVLTKYEPYPNYPSKISHINLGVIEGGTKISIVPDKCFLHCGIHTIPEQKVDDIITQIKEFAAEYKQNDPDLDLTITIPLTYKPQTINQNSEFALSVKNSIATVFQEQRDFRFNIATNDGHFFMENGIETIQFGCGGVGNNVYGPDEFVNINDLLNTTKMYAITALKYLR
ncbi:MAG: M20 family peptidase [Promethearchaeota archaeon]|nr:MAG: M20 family peptidase [Candidatus Lokiarchaeota archaeon]